MSFLGVQLQPAFGIIPALRLLSQTPGREITFVLKSLAPWPSLLCKWQWSQLLLEGHNFLKTVTKLKCKQYRNAWCASPLPSLPNPVPSLWVTAEDTWLHALPELFLCVYVDFIQQAHFECLLSAISLAHRDFFLAAFEKNKNFTKEILENKCMSVSIYLTCVL